MTDEYPRTDDVAGEWGGVDVSFGEQDGAASEAKFSTPNGLAYDPKRDMLYTNDYLLTWPERLHT